MVYCFNSSSQESIRAHLTLTWKSTKIPFFTHTHKHVQRSISKMINGKRALEFQRRRRRKGVASATNEIERTILWKSGVQNEMVTSYACSFSFAFLLYHTTPHPSLKCFVVSLFYAAVYLFCIGFSQCMRCTLLRTLCNLQESSLCICVYASHFMRY